MYFSSQVKRELANIMPDKWGSQRGELIAFILLLGRMEQKTGALEMFSSQPMLNRIIYYLFKKQFQIEVVIDRIKKGSRKKNYLISVPDKNDAAHILNSLKIKNTADGFILIPKNHLHSQNDGTAILKGVSIRAFLRGIFLVNGFVNDPEKMYHLEMSFLSRDKAEMICQILQSLSFSGKISYWHKKWAVYFKGSEQIFEFLRFIGTQRSLLKYQDIIARKELLNTVNRLVNCETANLDKTILSASRQLYYIDVLKKEIGLENLPAGLKEVINMRLKYPYASIQELSNYMDLKISKSGLFHRLKKIEALAKALCKERPYLHLR